MLEANPLILALGLFGSAAVGAITYSFRAGATHKEVMLKLEFMQIMLEKVEKRIDNLEKRYEYDGQYLTQRFRRPHAGDS
jgi:hypothetical protein